MKEKFNPKTDIKAGMLVVLGSGERCIAIPTKSGEMALLNSFDDGYKRDVLSEPFTDKFEIKAVYALTDSMRAPLDPANRELLWEKKPERTNEELFRLMWRFKAEHPEMNKENVIDAFYEEYDLKEHPLNDCYACEEAKDNDSSFGDCDKTCPLVLGGMDRCSSAGSLYAIEKAFRKVGSNPFYNRNNRDFTDDNATVCKHISELPWGEQK